MRVYLSVDLEGIGGVTHWPDVIISGRTTSGRARG